MTKSQSAAGPAGAGQRPDVNYPASKNGLDYLVHVVASLATDAGELPGERSLKYAVPHLQTGVEVLLKVNSPLNSAPWRRRRILQYVSNC
ncbi:hypothetical protein [Streptomyces griseoluteus]